MVLKLKYISMVTVVAIAICLSGLFTGCPEESIVPELETIEWESDGDGFIQFSTNDPQWHNYWFTVIYNQVIPTFTTLTAELKRVSGYYYALYGINFCSQDFDNYYELIIDIDGGFSVYKQINSSWIPLINWTYSLDLIKGYNQINKIKIDRDGSGNFSITFNDAIAPSATFTDTSFPGGSLGMVCNIDTENNEDFPTISNNTKYRFLEPASIP